MFVLFSPLPSFLALSFILPNPVVAFTFIPGAPSQCDNLPISWTGGTPPFQLLLTPVFGTPQNISIPTSAFNNGTGSFSMPLQMPQSAQLLLTMSDATGFNSGGTTPVLTVGASKGGSSCNTTNPAIAFSFQLNSALTQCRPFAFTAYTGAVQPVTIAVFVPGGTAFELNPPVGPTSFSWTTDVANGTSMIFSMTDAQGRQGGSSDIMIVGDSDDTSCLDSQSPSSTTAAPSPTASTSATSGSSASSTAVSSHGISIAAIAGTVIGGLLFLAVIITLALFLLSKRRGSQTSGNARKLSRTIDSEIDLSYIPRQVPAVTPFQNYDAGLTPRPYHPNADPSLNANPFEDHPSRPVAHYQMPSQHQHPGAFQSPLQHYPPDSGYPPGNLGSHSSRPSLSRTEFEPGQSTPRESMTTSQRKSAMTGVTTYSSARYVIHRDADDDLPQPNDDGVVELPPQYSERRGMLGIANPTPDSNADHPLGKFPS